MSIAGHLRLKLVDVCSNHVAPVNSVIVNRLLELMNMARTTHIGWIALFLLLLGGATRVLAQGDVHAIAEKVDQRYNRMQTLQAQFAETYSGAGMTRTESGTLELKKPGRMRWDYEQPRPKMFLTDGTTAWFYVPGEKQARRAPVKQIEDLRSPLRYLLGKSQAGEGVRRAGDCYGCQASECGRHRIARSSEGDAGEGFADAAGSLAGWADSRASWWRKWMGR